MDEYEVMLLKGIVSDWAEGLKYIRSVFVYGSRARGEYSDVSDLDIAIEFDESCFGNDSNCFAMWVHRQLEVELTLKDALGDYFPMDLHVELYCEGWTDRICRAVKEDGVLLFIKHAVA